VGFCYRPFRQLTGSWICTAQEETPPATPASPSEGYDEEDLFRREMADVRPLPEEKRSRVPRENRARNVRTVVNPEAEALALLSELVEGSGQFDITNSTEFLEGCAVGVDHRLLRRLRAGEFAYQSHLDLHGKTVKEAKEAVSAFLTAAYQRGQRCVLIIHGRGLNSEGHSPVLKRHLTDWLARGHWARIVLAFTSARPCDGGLGALYVLLRKRRRKKEFIRVTQGANW
jgi:DNA-nicking Smr family endonuclease